MIAPESASILSMLIGSADPDRLTSGTSTRSASSRTPTASCSSARSASWSSARRVAPTAAEPGRYLLNFHVPDIKAAAEHLDGLGVTWVAPVEFRDAGLWFGTVTDPDGNYVQLIETTPDYFRLKQERADAAG